MSSSRGSLAEFERPVGAGRTSLGDGVRPRLVRQFRAVPQPAHRRTGPRRGVRLRHGFGCASRVVDLDPWLNAGAPHPLEETAHHGETTLPDLLCRTDSGSCESAGRPQVPSRGGGAARRCGPGSVPGGAGWSWTREAWRAARRCSASWMARRNRSTSRRTAARAAVPDGLVVLRRVFFLSFGLPWSPLVIWTRLAEPSRRCLPPLVMPYTLCPLRPVQQG